MSDHKNLGDATIEMTTNSSRQAAELTYKKAGAALELSVALKKFQYGDGLNDEEFAAVYELFTRAEQDLWELTKYFNAGFGLARASVNSSLQTLEGFKRARDERKRNV